MELMKTFNNSGKKTPKRKWSAPGEMSCSRKQLIIDSNGDETSDHGEGLEDTVSDNYSDNRDSSEEGFSDNDSQAMDRIINDKSNEHDEHISVINDNAEECPPSPGTIALCADDIFCHDYIVNPPVMHLKPVSKTLAEIFTNWCRVAPQKEEVKEMFKQALVPINIEDLYPVRINDALYKKLPFKARVADQRLRGLNTFLARGMGPLVSIFHELCNIEAAAKSATNKSVVKLDEEGKLCLDSVTVDFVDMRHFLGTSLRLLSAAHSNLLLKRQLSLKPYLDRKFHHLTKESNPVTTLLLGGDLEQKISEVTKVSEVAKCLTINRTPRGHQF